MDKYLLNISIGPVQEFIASARRTADLWFGSYMLSEISKAAASAILDEKGVKLIFPHESALDKKATGEELSVANIILAEVDGNNGECVVTKAKEAVNNEWDKLTIQARSRVNGLIDEELWKAQINDAIEFYYAWVKIDNTDGGYTEARKKLARLMGGRKAMRDFKQNQGKPGVHKSSLDGCRESVLLTSVHGKADNPDLLLTLAKLKIRKGEHLDAIGLVKRLADASVTFPSVERVAVDSWVRGAEKLIPGCLKGLCEISEGMGDDRPFAKYTKSAGKVNPYKYADEDNPYRYEGASLFTNRLQEIETELKNIYKDNPQQVAKLQKTLNAICEFKKELRKVCEKLAAESPCMKEPNPYLAVVVADGDHMGSIISLLDDADKNREFSAALSKFAYCAEKIVIRNNGACVYTGGDDVFAFVPVDCALQCADKLKEAFKSALEKYKSHAPDDKEPSLSVGVAIAHSLETLDDLRKFGREAEALAKGDGLKDSRNALAVSYTARGGASVSVRGQWDDKNCLYSRLQNLTELFADGVLSKGFIFEIAECLNFYENWGDSELKASAMVSDVRRAYANKDNKPHDCVKGIFSKESLAENIKSWHNLKSFVDEMYIAMHIADSCRQAGGNN